MTCNRNSRRDACRGYLIGLDKLDGKTRDFYRWGNQNRKRLKSENQ